MYPKHEDFICNAAKITVTEEEGIMVKKSFQDLFNNKEIASRYNKEDDFPTKDDHLVATNGTSQLL